MVVVAEGGMGSLGAFCTASTMVVGAVDGRVCSGGKAV